MRLINRPLLFLACLLLPILAIGCQSLPVDDLQDFGQTIRLTREAAEMTLTELSAGLAANAQDKQALERQTRLDDPANFTLAEHLELSFDAEVTPNQPPNWLVITTSRLQTLDVVLEYQQALLALAQGQSADDEAHHLLQSFSQLASLPKFALADRLEQLHPAAALAAQVLREMRYQLDQKRGGEAILAANPIIQKLIDLLLQDAATYARIEVQRRQLAHDLIHSRVTELLVLIEAPTTDANSASARQRALATCNELLRQYDPLQFHALLTDHTEESLATQDAGKSPTQADYQAWLVEVERLLEQAQSEHDKLKQYHQLWQQYVALLHQLRDQHTRLVTAVTEDESHLDIDLQALKQTALRLHAAYRIYKEQSHD